MNNHSFRVSSLTPLSKIAFLAIFKIWQASQRINQSPKKSNNTPLVIPPLTKLAQYKWNTSKTHKQATAASRTLNPPYKTGASSFSYA